MRAAAAAAPTTTAAASAAIELGEILGRGDASEFQGEGNVFADLPLQGFEFLLGLEKFPSHLVVEQCIARGFEIADFRSPEFDAGVLFLMEVLAAFVDALILEAGGIVIEESFDALLELQKHRVLGNMGTELTGFQNDGGIFSGDGHAAFLRVTRHAGNREFAGIFFWAVGSDDKSVTVAACAGLVMG